MRIPKIPMRERDRNKIKVFGIKIRIIESLFYNYRNKL